MRFFTLLLDSDDRGIPEEVCRRYEAMPRRRGLEFQWRRFDHAAVLTAWDDPWGDPLVVGEGSWLAVGMVRLDNRIEVERLIERKGEGLSDLQLVLKLVARYGTKYIPQILGDFCFVVWDSATRAGSAATDVFGVRPLYCAHRDGLWAWSSRAEPLALDGGYELRYLVGLLTTYAAPSGLSVYSGVQAVPPASLATFGGRPPVVRVYWSAANCPIDPTLAVDVPAALETCRNLLIESVRVRVTNPSETWGQLSGGLDSSSVVSLASWMAERGEVNGRLAGTVTYVDRLGTQTDERDYSNAVVQRYGLRNVAIVDPPMWYDADYPPIGLDQPGLDFHVQPRERRLCEEVRRSGGRVLLTGYGGDELFSHNLLFLADWVAKGKVLTALREAAYQAAAARSSFWKLAFRNALLPLLPRAARPWRLVGRLRPVAWVHAAAVNRYGRKREAVEAQMFAGSWGRKHHHAAAVLVQDLQGVVHGGVLSDVLEPRHPLLYRPLVEFALSLPWRLRVRPPAHRWVLRQVMRDILPERVRARIGKPDTSDVLVWCLRASELHLRDLTKDSILAEMGVIDPAKFDAALESAIARPSAALSMHTSLFPTLAVEAWLRIRSGRWPRDGHLSGDMRSPRSTSRNRGVAGDLGKDRVSSMSGLSTKEEL